MSEQITTLTDATFDEVIGTSEKPILVDFWPNGGPCKMIARSSRNWRSNSPTSSPLASSTSTSMSRPRPVLGDEHPDAAVVQER